MTDITKLAQRNELLIANGQQTADLLRHLADNEIDSDYFAVVSECESYGKETDAELSITEFALRAAGYVDELVEALEKAQQHIVRQEQILLNQDESLSIRRGELEAAQQERDNWHTSFDNERFRADKLKAHIDDIEPIRASAEKLVRCKGRYHSEQNYRALAALFSVTTPDLPPVDEESRTVTVKLPPKIERDDAEGWFMYNGGRVGGGAAEWYNKALDDVKTGLTAAGIREADDLLHMAASAIEDLLEHTDPNTSYYSGVWADVPGKLRAAAMFQAGNCRENKNSSTNRSREHFILLCNEFWNWSEMDMVCAEDRSYELRMEWDGKVFKHPVTQALWRMYQAAQ
ncbi:TPA: hypothetical protein ACYEOW_004860 [Raoultella terrigena]